jgi:hypothetical protein
MTRAGWVLLLPCLVCACDEDDRPPATYPAVVDARQYAADLPPAPVFVSTTSGTCDDEDMSGCENRCADGDAPACERLREKYARAYPTPAPAPTRVEVTGGAQVLQFFGPVENVNVGQPAPRR